jgi:hypothetical protein
VSELRFYTGDEDGSAICYDEDDFHDVTYDLILHTAMANSTARTTMYPGFYEILATQTPGRDYTDCQNELQLRFGLVQHNRRWFARLFRQTIQGIRSAADTIAVNTIT